MPSSGTPSFEELTRFGVWLEDFLVAAKADMAAIMMVIFFLYISWVLCFMFPFSWSFGASFDFCPHP